MSRHFIDDVIIEYNAETEHGAKRISQKQLQEFKETFQIAEETLSQSLKDIVYHDKEIDIPLLLDMINSVLEKSDNDANLCDMLFKMKVSDQSLYAHSINVSILAQILAKWANFTEEEIEFSGIAGLLHDIGLLKYYENGIACISLRDEFEKKNYEKHVLYGYNMIKNKDIDYRIKQAVLTHHERFDMSGFPLKVSFSNINNISRVLAIADTYDTLTRQEYDDVPKVPLS